jgi:hypothetical protein
VAAKKKKDLIEANKIADCLRCDFLPESYKASTRKRPAAPPHLKNWSQGQYNFALRAPKLRASAGRPGLCNAKSGEFSNDESDDSSEEGDRFGDISLAAAVANRSTTEIRNSRNSFKTHINNNF